MVDNVTFLVSKKRRGRLVKKCSISVEIDLSPKCGTQLKTHIQNECLGMFFSFFVGLKVFFFWDFLEGVSPQESWEAIPGILGFFHYFNIGSMLISVMYRGAYV